MKLHSETSVGWLILFGFILASLSGTISTIDRLQPPVKTNGYQKDSRHDYTLIDNLRGTGEQTMYLDSIQKINYFRTKITGFRFYGR